MNEQLNKLIKLVENYETGSDNPHMLIELQKHITSTLFYLETERAKVHDNYKRIIFELTKKKENEKPMSIAQASNIADVQCPEMYQLRRVMEGAYRVSDAIRTHISFLKQEMNNIN